MNKVCAIFSLVLYSVFEGCSIRGAVRDPINAENEVLTPCFFSD